MSDPANETFESFAKRVRAVAGLTVPRGGKTVPFANLSEKDQNAYIDRWHADGEDPTMAKHTASERSAGTAAAPRAPSVDIPVENWVGWCLRPYDGGWKLRRITIPVHVMEMFVTDQPSQANRRELIVAQVAAECGHPSLTTRTEWGTPIGHTPDPVEPETVEMVDSWYINQLGNKQALYRRVPKAAYLALPEEVRANHPLRLA